MPLSACTIQTVQPHHNPNEGRVIINSNFECLSGAVSTLESAVLSGGSNASTLSQVLVIGNETGVNNIIISSGQTISSSSGGGQLDLNKGGVGYVSLNTDDGNESEAGLSMNPTTINIFSNGYNKGFYLTNTETEWWNQDADENNQKTIITIGPQRVFWGHNNSNFDRTWNQGVFPAALALNASSPTFLSGVSNSIILGGGAITATTDNTAYVPNLNIDTAPTPTSGSTGDKILVRSSNGSVKTLSVIMKEISIGDWNMDIDVTKSVAHGLSSTEWKTIRQVSGIIRDDLDFTYSTLTPSYDSPIKNNANIAQISSSNINLIRDGGGVYDSAIYSATSFNRGWITFWYTPD